MVRQEEERAALHCKRGQYSELRSNVVSHEMSVSSGDSTSYENGPSAQQTGGWWGIQSTTQLTLWSHK